MTITALTVRQPWVDAIFRTGKDVENRSRNFRFRGHLWIHAANTDPEYEAYQLAQKLAGRRKLPSPVSDRYGAIVGRVTVLNCVTKSDSVWFSGPFGLVLSQPIELETPIPCRGQLGLWRVPTAVSERLALAIGGAQ